MRARSVLAALVLATATVGAQAHSVVFNPNTNPLNYTFDRSDSIAGYGAGGEIPASLLDVAAPAETSMADSYGTTYAAMAADAKSGRDTALPAAARSTQVPEPAPYVLILAGVVGAWWIAHRRRRRT